mgnify:CR=1 FL=1
MRGGTKTQIAYNARINFKQANEYINYLVERNIITDYPIDSRRIYRLTDKGKKLLHHLENVLKMLSCENEH